MKIVVDLVYVEWGSGHRARSLAEAMRCIGLAGAEVDRLVIADNKLDCMAIDGVSARQVIVVPGNNLAREFSGWDEGFRALGPDGRASVLLFVNDTFAAHRRIRLARRWRIARWIRHVSSSGRPEMFGAFDSFGKTPGTWLFGALDKYISSYLFGMNPDAARLLFPLTAIDPELERLLAAEYSTGGLFTEELPQAFRRRIEDWLFTVGNWRNAAALSPANFAFFRLKAKSILYEYALTSRATELGVAVNDLFTGRGRADELMAYLARTWTEMTSTGRYPWLRAVKAKLLNGG